MCPLNSCLDTFRLGIFFPPVPSSYFIRTKLSDLYLSIEALLSTVCTSSLREGQGSRSTADLQVVEFHSLELT